MTREEFYRQYRHDNAKAIVLDRLMTRGYGSNPKWWGAGAWERVALRAYAAQIAARYYRIYGA